MRNILTTSLLLLLGAVLAAQVTDKDLLTPDPNDFLLYSGTYDSQRHSLLKQINTTNVGTLQAKWIFHLTGAKDLEAPPIVYKGVMYIGQYNRVHALDAATGRLIWEYMRQPPSVGWQRGIGIYGDMVYMVAQDSALVALDRRTGNPHVGSASVAAGQALPGSDAVCRQGPGHHERQRAGRRLHRGVRRDDRQIQMVVELDSEAGRARQRNVGRRLVEKRRRPGLGERQLRSAAQSDLLGHRPADARISSATTAKATTSTPTASSRSTSTPAR